MGKFVHAHLRLTFRKFRYAETPAVSAAAIIIFLPTIIFLPNHRLSPHVLRTAYRHANLQQQRFVSHTSVCFTFYKHIDW